jgi:DMSO reductase family type II enzyme heme b subunit
VFALVTPPPAVPSTTIPAVYVSGDIALDPGDPVWAQAQETEINLTRRLNEAGARIFRPDEKRRNIKVKALHNGNDIFFLCQWSEDSASASVDDYPVFADAFAMQFPLFTEDGIICMGSIDKPVNIIFWRADLPSPENVVAGGMGTPQTSPDAASQNIRHYQDWSNKVWSVIIARPMAAASENQVSFRRGANYRIAFANWRGGAYGERGGHKIVSEWHSLSIK